ncbi:MAG: hypothetical protein HYZ75_13395 [Elusimicrobia bacterium]|nr:hypothetical protein [Elusimicrobiota bacterium]
MPRKARPELATKEDLRAAFVKVAVELQDRPTRSEMREGFDALKGQLDRMMGTLDRISGENFDIRRTLTVFDAMFRDNRRMIESHERRLTTLEVGLPPPTA